MSKIFLTGATGYIGGEVLYRLTNQSGVKHQIACLVRDKAKASTVLKSYPDVRIVEGDLDNTESVEAESRKADVVLHLASTKHAPSSQAIAKGLSNASRTSIGHWIQISGSSLFSGAEIKANRYGESAEKVYDDLANESEIWDLISQTPTRVVEQLVQAQDPAKVKTALIIGPLFYGLARGPANVRSIQGPDMARYTIQNGHAFQVGSGQSAWSNLHVRDLSALIVALVDAASSEKSGIWNKEGLYCPENGVMTFGEIAAQIAKTAKDQGLISEEGVKSLSNEETNKFMPHGGVLLGTNAKQKSPRARERLGWTPSEASLEASIPEMVKLEAQRLK